VPVWYEAPLEMNEGTDWGQGYNRLTNSCSAADRPNKRPLTFNFVNKFVHIYFDLRGNLHLTS
jgi:hypothetical protein